MSLKQKTERAVRQVITDSLIDAPLDPALTLLTSQENQTTTVKLPLADIQALGGPNLSPKTRVVKMRTLIAVRTSADRQTPEDPTEELPENIHTRYVDRVTTVLNVPDLKTLLTAAVADFSCQAVIPRGEVEVPKPEGERSFCTAWAYELWVSEATIT